MITAIRQVRRAKGLTLEEVAQRCVPPTTAQTIGRLETGTRTVSVDWLNRIAAALEVAPADLVTLPERTALPVAATPLFTGGDFNSMYNATRAPVTVAIPADAVKVQLVALVTGHGAGTNQCSEFCNHQHVFTVDGAK